MNIQCTRKEEGYSWLSPMLHLFKTPRYYDSNYSCGQYRKADASVQCRPARWPYRPTDLARRTFTEEMFYASNVPSAGTFAVLRLCRDDGSICMDGQGFGQRFPADLLQEKSSQDMTRLEYPGSDTITIIYQS